MSTRPQPWEYSLEITYHEEGRNGRSLAGGVGDLSVDDDEVRKIYRSWLGCHDGCTATKVSLVRLTENGGEEFVKDLAWVIKEHNS